jgi:hypothetical protein
MDNIRVAIVDCARDIKSNALQIELETRASATFGTDEMGKSYKKVIAKRLQTIRTLCDAIEVRIK